MRTIKMLRDDTELAAVDDELRRTLDAVPHPIAGVESDGRTLGANASVLDYPGLQSDGDSLVTITAQGATGCPVTP